jgi:2'-hydroxyisoflavone reductase
VRLLVLGGTRFLGRHVAEQALERGWAVTLLHRGLTGAGLLLQAEHLQADRDADLSVLGGRRFDAVIDTCAYRPRQVAAALTAMKALAGPIHQYQLVSSISVYAPAPQGADEDSPRVTLADPDTEVVDGSTYGGLKALCEDVLTAALPQQACVVRPGLIVGPHDPTGRFTWWVRRMRRGGTVLAPGDGLSPVQCIDVRDLAAFMLDRAQAGGRGCFNATGPVGDAQADRADPAEPAERAERAERADASGPAGPAVDPRPAAIAPAAHAPAPSPGPLLTMAGFLEAARHALAAAPGQEPPLQWVDEAVLLARGVRPWVDLPLWLDRDNAWVARTRCDRAHEAGLRTRPLARTLRDTARWAEGRAPEPGVGLSPELEAQLLGLASAPSDP